MAESLDRSDALDTGTLQPVASARMRLLHVAPLPPPWTGIGVSVQHLIGSAPIKCHENWIIDTSTQRKPGDPNRPKVPTPGRIARHLRVTANVIRAIRRHRIQVVHLHGSSHDLSFVANGLAVLGARLAGARVVWHLHEDLSVVQFPGRSVATRSAFSLAMLLPDALAVVTPKDKEIAAQLVCAQKIVVIPESCSSAMLKLPLRREGTGARILYVGWLTNAKGIDDLLELAARLRAGHAEVTFDVLGSGMSDRETESVRERVSQLGLDSTVRLHGVVTGEAKRKAFAIADILLMPTHWDALPVTVLEAMAAGLPVVGTNVGGLPSMLENGRGAFLTEVGDVARMAEAVVALAADHERRFEMGRANRQRFCAQYHPDKIGQVTVDVYRRLALGQRTFDYSHHVRDLRYLAAGRRPD